MQIHGGQNENVALVGRWMLLTPRRIVECWKLTRRISDELGLEKMGGQPQGPVRPVWWNPSWVPVAVDGMGNDLCLDLDPPPAGLRGQLIEYVHDCEIRPVVAPSFAAWLSSYADELEAGLYEVDDFAGHVYRRSQS
jgi:cell wall assembly regulator SMI1